MRLLRLKLTATLTHDRIIWLLLLLMGGSRTSIRRRVPIGRQKTSSSSSTYSIGAIPRVFVHHMAVLFGSEAILFFVVSIVATAASVFILSEKMHHNPFKLGSGTMSSTTLF